MKGKRFTEEQIIAVLKEHEAGAKVPDLVRKYYVSEQSIYRWRSPTVWGSAGPWTSCQTSSPPVKVFWPFSRYYRRIILQAIILLFNNVIMAKGKAYCFNFQGESNGNTEVDRVILIYCDLLSMLSESN